MTIPELMYGATRYKVSGYLGDDLNQQSAQAAKVAGMSTRFAAIAIRNHTWSIVCSLLLFIFGLFAIGLPATTPVFVALIIRWLLILNSAIQALHAFHSEGNVSILWKLVVALLFFGAGIYFLTHPLLGIASLTLAIGLVFTAEAAMDFFGYLMLANPSSQDGFCLMESGLRFLDC